MKKLPLIFLIGLIALVLNSCKKNKGEPRPDVIPPGISFKIGSSVRSFPAEIIQGRYIIDHNGPYRISLIGKTDNEQVYIDIYVFKPGTYKLDLNLPENGYVTFYDELNFKNGGGGYYVIDGSITINSISESNVTGTFNYTGINITNIRTPITGTFNCNLVKESQ
jgi:hypothetical protein